MPRLDRQLLYSVATSDRVDDLVRRSPRLTETAYRRARNYVAGETLADALTTARSLVGEGFAVTLDRFGENLTDRAAVARIVDEYLELAGVVGEIEGDVDVEVVPSNLGIDVSVDFFCERAARVAERLPSGRLQVSAEESWRTPKIVDAAVRLAGDGVPLVSTLQANLRRTPEDADRLVDAGVAVRLVKGAYVEPPAAAHPWGEETDVAYLRLAHHLHGRDADLAIATHDPVVREALLLALDGVKVEMLLGVRPDDARDLLARGHHVRLYVPYGTEWLRYWLRRIAESRGS